jgi:hypothetical protein
MVSVDQLMQHVLALAQQAMYAVRLAIQRHLRQNVVGQISTVPKRALQRRPCHRATTVWVVHPAPRGQVNSSVNLDTFARVAFEASARLEDTPPE